MSSMIGKILDTVILNSYEEKLSLCDLQFGFKKDRLQLVVHLLHRK